MELRSLKTGKTICKTDWMVYMYFGHFLFPKSRPHLTTTPVTKLKVGSLSPGSSPAVEMLLKCKVTHFSSCRVQKRITLTWQHW